MYLALEASSLAEAEAEAEGSGDDVPNWSVRVPNRDNFVDMASAADFDEFMKDTGDSQLNVVQFFARGCK